MKSVLLHQRKQNPHSKGKRTKMRKQSFYSGASLALNSLALGKRQAQHPVLSTTLKAGKLLATSDDYNAAFRCPFSHGFIAMKQDMPQP